MTSGDQTGADARRSAASGRAWMIGSAGGWLLAALVAVGAVAIVPRPFPLAGLVVALLAGLVWWLASRRVRRAEIEALERIADRIGRIGEAGGAGRVTQTAEAVAAPLDADQRWAWFEEQIESASVRIDDRLVWLLETRAAMRAIIDGVDSPVFATDETGQIRLVNRAGERLFHRRSGKLAGIALEELFTSQPILDLHDRARGGESARIQIRMTLEGQARIFEVTASPVRMDIIDLPAQSKQRAGAVLTLRDVTDLAQAAQLKTDFVANASHELRTPIASIRVAIETMRLAADDPTMRDRATNMIEQHVVRLEEMVTDLLDLSHLESADAAPPAMEPVPMSEVVQTLSSTFEVVCQRRNLRLEFDLDDQLEQLYSDKRLLHLIVRNLIDNATKFAREETAIRVIGRVIGDPSGHARPGARFEVIDEGEGIPLKQQARVFERFFQVDESRTRQGRRGTGLGLAIVKHAVKRLGGEVAVESVWQEGTTFRVDLPACIGSPKRWDHADGAPRFVMDTDPADDAPLEDPSSQGPRSGAASTPES